jgi:23S rRNA (uracil1939-C5)-methyltransferase
MLKNEKYTVEIIDLNNLGFGVARVNNLVVFVPGLVTGDMAEIVIIKVKSSYAIGKLLRLITPGAARIEPECPAVGKCGGCAYGCVDYETEKRFKKERVKTALVKQRLSGIAVSDVVSTGKISGYRNKAEYPISEINGRLEGGFYAPKSHRVVPAESCMLCPPVFSEILACFLAFSRKNNLTAYNESTGKGLLRHLYLREANNSRNIVVCPVINDKKLPFSDELVKILTKSFPNISGLILNINTANTNVILGEKFVTLFGNPNLIDKLGDTELEISPASFYQVNRETCELLYGKVKELADVEDGDRILDLFCGIGSIGIFITKEKNAILTGLELSPDAVENAQANAKRNGLQNAKFKTIDLDKPLPENLPPSDIVILDPPRSGCSREVIKAVAELSPRKIIYISCNPETLARDLVLFAESGYMTGEITPFDMFPRTGHVEGIALLVRSEQ